MCKNSKDGRHGPEDERQEGSGRRTAAVPKGSGIVRRCRGRPCFSSEVFGSGAPLIGWHGFARRALKEFLGTDLLRYRLYIGTFDTYSPLMPQRRFVMCSTCLACLACLGPKAPSLTLRMAPTSALALFQCRH